uniref:Uncharacterized protein n=1 Tax=Nelumbo nucifera TaxID=4432 RepID=A0A822YLT0_NELNU|nr:TPA_asm: hypothetical protein HUJ06_011392 [Nelumbo nucifera]
MPGGSTVLGIDVVLIVVQQKDGPVPLIRVFRYFEPCPPVDSFLLFSISFQISFAGVGAGGWFASNRQAFLLGYNLEKF